MRAAGTVASCLGGSALNLVEDEFKCIPCYRWAKDVDVGSLV
jgi:hypothetical protein